MKRVESGTELWWLAPYREHGRPSLGDEGGLGGLCSALPGGASRHCHCCSVGCPQPISSLNRPGCAGDSARLYLPHIVPYCSPVGEPTMVNSSGKGESVAHARLLSLWCRSDPFPRGRLRPNGIEGPPNAFGVNLYAQARPASRAVHRSHSTTGSLP